MAEVTDARLALFRRQYLQQLDNLIYPPPEVLLEPLVQEELSKRFFDDAENPYLPPLSYQKRVLKTLTDTITSSIKDPEEEVCSCYCIAPASPYVLLPGAISSLILASPLHLFQHLTSLPFPRKSPTP